MMKVVIELSGPIRTPDGRRRLELDLPAGARVADALRAVGLPERQFGFLALSVAGAPARPDTPLGPEDRLRVHLAVGGG